MSTGALVFDVLEAKARAAASPDRTATLTVMGESMLIALDEHDGWVVGPTDLFATRTPLIDRVADLVTRL